MVRVSGALPPVAEGHWGSRGEVSSRRKLGAKPPALGDFCNYFNKNKGTSIKDVRS